MADPIINRIKIDKIFCNKRTGQYSIILPKKQMKSIPKVVEIVWK